MDTPLQVIDAFIDGERVDVAALKAALADASGRDYFADVWLMREAVRSDAVADLAPPVAAPVVASRRWQPRWLVAAGIAGGLIGGYAIGHGVTGRVVPSPAATVTPAITAAAPATTAFPVPAPTRVIQLDFHSASTAGGD